MNNKHKHGTCQGDCILWNISQLFDHEVTFIFDTMLICQNAMLQHEN